MVAYTAEELYEELEWVEVDAERLESEFADKALTAVEITKLNLPKNEIRKLLLVILSKENIQGLRDYIRIFAEKALDFWHAPREIALYIRREEGNPETVKNKLQECIKSEELENPNSPQLLAAELADDLFCSDAQLLGVAKFCTWRLSEMATRTFRRGYGQMYEAIQVINEEESNAEVYDAIERLPVDNYVKQIIDTIELRMIKVALKLIEGAKLRKDGRRGMMQSL